MERGIKKEKGEWEREKAQQEGRERKKEKKK